MKDVNFCKEAVSEALEDVPDRFSRAVTGLGSGFLVPFFLTLFWLIDPQSAVETAKGFFLMALVVGSIKIGFKRQRPKSQKVDTFSPYSFPSGHAASSVFLASEFSMAFPSAAPIFALLAGSVCLSRIQLKVHKPLDIIVGVVIGFGFSLLV